MACLCCSICKYWSNTIRKIGYFILFLKLPYQRDGQHIYLINTFLKNKPIYIVPIYQNSGMMNKINTKQGQGYFCSRMCWSIVLMITSYLIYFMQLCDIKSLDISTHWKRMLLNRADGGSSHSLIFGWLRCRLPLL